MTGANVRGKSEYQVNPSSADRNQTHATTIDTQGDLAALPARAWLHAYGRPIANDERARVAESLRARADTKAAVSDLCLALVKLDPLQESGAICN